MGWFVGYAVGWFVRGVAGAAHCEWTTPRNEICRTVEQIAQGSTVNSTRTSLGYVEGDAAGRGSGNNRNGTSPKTVLTEIGPVNLDIPRDRNGSFETEVGAQGHSAARQVQLQHCAALRPGSVDS